MRQARISKGGQVSIPADVRHRWGTVQLLVEDRGDELILRPLPDDPIRAVRGSLRGSAAPGIDSGSARRQMRAEEDDADDRRHERRR